jgi:V8-like Glu-specific endopeptidase
MGPYNPNASRMWRRHQPRNPRPHSYGFQHEMEESAPASSCGCGCSGGCGSKSRKTDSGEASSSHYSHGISREVAPQGSNQCAAANPMRPVGDVTQIPSRWVCRIRVQAQRGHSFASGILVSPWHVLTAAHAIHFREEPDAWRTIEVGPAFSAASPTSLKSNGWIVDPRWNVRDCRTDGSDLALIRLARPLGRDFRNIVRFAPADISGKPCIVMGYPSVPGDVDVTRMFQSNGRINGSIVISECTPTTANGRLLQAITPSTLMVAHDADSDHSMSGGPVFVLEHGAPKLVAIHVGTVGGGCIKKAVLLTERIQTQIRTWINQTLHPL